MKDKEFIIEQELRDIYYNPSTGYQSIERLYQKAKESGLKVSRKLADIPTSGPSKPGHLAILDNISPFLFPLSKKGDALARFV